MSDKFTIVPILVAIVLIGLSLAFGYSALNFERFDGLWLLSLLLSCMAFLGGLVLLVVRLVRRQWRASTSLALALALLVGCFLARFELYFQIDRIRFQMFKEYYVGALTDGDVSSILEPRAMRWGLWVYFMTGPIYRELMYDPADKLAEPNGVEDARIQKLLES